MSGDVVVVTGATRGLGRAIALELARRGKRLVLVGRSTAERPNRVLPGTLESIAAEISSAGADCLAVPADIGNEADVARVVAAAYDTYGRVDALVNNAAVSFVGGFLDVAASKWRAALAVDLLGPVMLSQALLPGMLERERGVIVSLSSSAVHSDDVPQLPYSIAKGGLERLTVGLHRQYGGSGVAVSCVRIDEVIPTEAVVLHAPELVESSRSTPEAFAVAVAWLLEQPVEEVGGVVLTMDGLRARGALPARVPAP